MITLDVQRIEVFPNVFGFGPKWTVENPKPMSYSVSYNSENTIAYVEVIEQ